MNRVILMGKELGYEGQNLQDFIKQQYDGMAWKKTVRGEKENDRET